MSPVTPNHFAAMSLWLVPVFVSADGAFALPPIAVIAPSDAKAQFSVPYSTSVIDRQRATTELQTKTLPDALRYEPSVMIQQTGVGQYSPYIRGLTGYRTLLMVDGIRLNNAAMRDGPNQYWGTVDPLMIDRYEVIRGSSSALYGSDAIGGTMNVTTQSWMPREDGQNWGGRLYYRFGSADTSHFGRVEMGGQAGNWDAIFGGSGKVFNDLTTGRGQDNPHTDYDQESMNAKIRYHFNDRDMLTLVHQYDTQSDVWRAHSTIYGVSFDGTGIGNNLARPLNQRRQLSYARYEADDVGFMDRMSLTFSYQQMAENETLVKSNGSAETFNFHDNTLGLQAKANSASQIGLLDYGVEYYHDDIDSDGNQYNASGNVIAVKRQGTVADKSTYDQVGIYLQDTYIWRDFEFTLGGRFNHAQVHLGRGLDLSRNANIDNFDKNWNNAVGNGRILYHIDEHWNVYAGISQGWRSPSVYDLSGQGFSRSREVQTYSLNVKPEEFVTYEIGLKTQFKNLETSIAYFYNDINNMIVRAPVANPANPSQALTFNGNTVVEARNAGAGHIQGIEWAGFYRVDTNWSMSANFTWTDSRIQDYPGTNQQTAPTPITRMLPINGTVGIRWDAADRKFWAESTLTAVAGQTRLSFSDQRDNQRIPPGGTPGYALWGIRGGWQPTESLRTALAVENLTDEDYRVHGSGINGPGRQVVVSMDYAF